jgi:two-component system, cell cycle sensor histidine kinase and response regulator CckA
MGVADAVRVLILEDRKSDLELIVHELRQAGFDPQYRHVTNERDFRASLADGWDLVLADYTLPQFDALRALRIVRETIQNLPFIVVTGSISEEAAVLCMKEGATDYLLKDRLARLGGAVRQALEGRRLQAEKARATEQIRLRNRELMLLNRIIAASAEKTDEIEFLHVACREILGAFDVARVVAGLFNGERTEVAIVAEYFLPGAPAFLGRSLPVSTTSVTGLATQIDSPLILDDVLQSPFLQGYRAVLEREAVASLLIIPLEVGGQVIGGIGCVSTIARHFTDEHVALARSLAGQLSGALARSRLERDRRLLDSAIAQTKDGVIVMNAVGTIIYINPGFEAMSGFSGSEVVGKPIQTIVSGGNDAEAGREIPLRLLAGTEWRGRLSNRRKDGTLYTVDASISPAVDAEGRPVSFVSVQRDISEQLEMEKRYLQSQKMEAVGRLAGGVAHDFNNLLTAVLVYTDMLAEQIPEGSPAAENLQEVRKAGERAATLTRQLLTFSRRQTVLPRVLDLRTVVTDFEKMLRRLIGDDVRLSTSLASEPCMVRADPGQMEQVIMNLVVNARDAMPEGGELAISTECVHWDDLRSRGHPDGAPGTYVILRVSDTGVGMSPEVISHVFEPFYTTKEEGKGTGLGLATVYGIVKQAGGWVWATSALGKGSTFHISLPRIIDAGNTARIGEAGEPMKRGTEAVLVAEDDETVRKLVERVLTSLGYSVCACTTPDEALQKARTAHFDILVTDMVMPDMNGQELARRVRALVAKIAILHISGYSNTILPQSVPGERQTHFLQKPFTPAKLAASIRTALDDPRR